MGNKGLKSIASRQVISSSVSTPAKIVATRDALGNADGGKVILSAQGVRNGAVAFAMGAPSEPSFSALEASAIIANEQNSREMELSGRVNMTEDDSKSVTIVKHANSSVDSILDAAMRKTEKAEYKTLTAVREERETRDLTIGLLNEVAGRKNYSYSYAGSSYGSFVNDSKQFGKSYSYENGSYGSFVTPEEAAMDAALGISEQENPTAKESEQNEERFLGDLAPKKKSFWERFKWAIVAFGAVALFYVFFIRKK